MIPKDEINSRKQEKVSLNFIPDRRTSGRARRQLCRKFPMNTGALAPEFRTAMAQQVAINIEVRGA